MPRKPEPLAPPASPDDGEDWKKKHEAQLKRLTEFPPVFYDKNTKEFWFELDGEWCPIKKSELKQLHFTKGGLRNFPFYEADGKTHFTELDWPIWNAQVKNKVAFAGSVAGRRKGKHDFGCVKYLVTDECSEEIWAADIAKKLALPKWFIDRTDELLPPVKLESGEVIEQAELFKFWLGIGLESLVKQTFQQGQLVVLAGESGCGKSAMQAIITKVLGDREFNPMKSWLEGRFNSGLAGAEHWKIEDPESTLDMKTRYRVGQRMKQAVINVAYEIEKKGKDSLSLPLFRRPSFTCNLDPTSLAALPPLNNGLEDKIFMFQCERADWGADVAEVTARLEKERHQIRSYLLNYYNAARVPAEWKIGRDGKLDRMKIRAWQHPELLEMLGAISPEAKLLLMIDETIFAPCSKDDGKRVVFRKPFEGLARELERKLKDSKNYSEPQLERIFPDTARCGTLLDQLSRSNSRRVEKLKGSSSNSGKVIWRIHPPKETNE